MLPEAKSEFPKCLYLDQNKWIDLGRAHYGRPDGAEFRPCLEAIRTAVGSGKLVVPFSLVNAIEAMIQRDEGRRKRLAEFMVDLSGNRTMAPENVVAPLEIANATRTLFGVQATEVPRKSLVHVGLIHAIGMGPELQALMPPVLGAGFSAMMSTPAATVKFLMDSGSDRVKIDAARAGEAGARDIFESDRAVTATMSLATRRREELFGLIGRNREYRIALEATLKAIGRTWDEFRAEMGSDERLQQFIASVPNFDVFITLRIEREKDKDRKIDHNDIRDLDWMSVAVPYSNVVVSERYWGNKVVATGLAAKYETALITDLRELPTHLKESGCLA